MAFSRLREGWRKLLTGLKRAVIQDCPPEIAACENCRRLQCQSGEWKTCENRLAAQRVLESCDQRVVEASQRANPATARAGACCETEVGVSRD